MRRLFLVVCNGSCFGGGGRGGGGGDGFLVVTEILFAWLWGGGA